MFSVGEVKKTPNVQMHKMPSKAGRGRRAALSAQLAPGHVAGGCGLLSLLAAWALLYITERASESDY